MIDRKEKNLTLKVIKTDKAKKGKLLYNSKAVYKVMRFIEKKDREYFYVLHLDGKLHMIAKELIAIRTLTTASVHPREVFKGAILNNSAGIICVHNHPSGDPNPSSDDIKITQRLKKVGDIIGISLMDHIIIGNKTFISMNECCTDRGQRQASVEITKENETKKSVVDLVEQLDMDLSFSKNVVEVISAMEESGNRDIYEWLLFETIRKLAHAKELSSMLYRDRDCLIPQKVI